MHFRRLPIHVALLGSALGLAALAPAAGANLSLADKEILALRGHLASQQNSAASHVMAASRMAGSGFTVLHSFAGPPSDGSNPDAEVTLDKSGNIYGTTDFGGASGGYGTIYEITKSGTESLLHSFGGTGDGTTPDGAVTFDAQGNMYGSTEYGGITSNGVVWELAANGTYTVLHSFALDEGTALRGRLTEDSAGNFYGTALFGGNSDGDGTVFKITTSGTLTVVHTFGGADGQYPEHGVVMDSAGNIYGVTAFGGANDHGAIYKIATDGTFTTLYSFTAGNDGAFPYGAPTIDKDGNLYGNAAWNGADSDGTVYKLTPNGTLTVLHTFTGQGDGADPEGDMLLLGKNLYSTTTSGGAHSQGGVFELSSSGKLKVLANFTYTGTNLDYSAGLTRSGKYLYGTALYQGTSQDGSVYRLKNKTKKK